MASPLGWLRALLALLQRRFQSDSGERWVEPGNEITRAILAGTVPLLAAPIRPSAEAPTAAAVAASEPLAVEHTPLPQVEVALEVEPEVEAPAADLPDESTETTDETSTEAPRKAGRAA